MQSRTPHVMQICVVLALMALLAACAPVAQSDGASPVEAAHGIPGHYHFFGQLE